MPRSTAYRCLALVTLLALVAGCASRPKPPSVKRSQMAPVVDYALSLRGTPYVWGGESFEEGGFDCSGFVQHVYRRHGIRLPRTARQMAEALPPLADGHRQPGDLVFFNTTGEPYSHVGIYIGHDDFVHSSSAKHGVVVSSLSQPYWETHFLGVRRPSLMERWLGSADSRQ